MDKEKSFLSKVKTFLFQMIPVMLGVYLGIFAGNCNEAQQQAQLKTQIIQKIKGEIEANHQQITEALNYHEQLKDSIELFIKTTPKELMQKPVYQIEDKNFRRYYWRGTRTSPLKSTGYETAIVTGVLVEMDLDLVSSLANIQSQQKKYQEMSASYLSVLISKGGTDILMDYASFVSFFSTDIVYSERELLEMYEETLKLIEKLEK